MELKLFIKLDNVTKIFPVVTEIDKELVVPNPMHPKAIAIPSFFIHIDFPRISPEKFRLQLSDVRKF